MDKIDIHWSKVNDGAQVKADELSKSLGIKIEVEWLGCPQDDLSIDKQSGIVDNSINKQVDVIILTPLNYNDMDGAIERAKAAGIPVVLADSDANTSAWESFLGTDNAAAARLAADELAKKIGGSGKVAIINTGSGAGTVKTREDAFKSQMEKYPNIEIVGTEYCNGDPIIASGIARDFMNKYSDLVGIYACNEGCTIGMGNAIKAAGKAGQVHAVGFDWTDEIKSLVKDGVIDAAIVQNPYKMGYLGVQTAIDILLGKSFKRIIDTGVIIVNKGNADTIE